MARGNLAVFGQKRRKRRAWLSVRILHERKGGFERFATCVANPHTVKKKEIIMKKTEKIIAAALTIALGVLLIILKASVVSILMTVLGVGLIALGIVDLVHKLVPPSVVKIVAGAVIILCGWVIVRAVLYIVAALLLVAGIILLYEKIKAKACMSTLWKTVCDYAVPVVFILIGLLLLFNQGNTMNWVFVLSGIFTVIEGGLLFVNAIAED
jgi:hypothetical protein